MKRCSNVGGYNYRQKRRTFKGGEIIVSVDQGFDAEKDTVEFIDYSGEETRSLYNNLQDEVI